MVINKPAGYHTLLGKSTFEPSIEDWLKQNFAPLRKLPEAGLVHRLDFLTTGCLLVAKDQETLKELSHSFRTGSEIQKIYLALASGNILPGRFRLYFSSRYRSSKIVTVQNKGKARDLGECQWTVLKKNTDYSLLEVALIGPGKRHQIRAGFAHLGHPLWGDNLYNETASSSQKLGLHAWKLRISGAEISAPQPSLFEHF